MFKLACVTAREFVDGLLYCSVTKDIGKGTCLRKEASVYFAANPTGCQVHNRRHPFSDILKPLGK